MRIFFFTPFMIPQSNAAAVRCFWLVKTLKDAGHSVQTWSSINTEHSQSLCLTPADNKQSFLKRLLFEALTGIELFFRILFARSDLYVLSSPPFISILLAHYACRLKGSKYIIDVRDIYPEVYFAQGLIRESSLPGRIVGAMTRSMYEKAHGVLSVTPGLVQKIRARAPKARAELLINGFDAELFAPTTKKYEKFTVMFHGNMGKVQNLSTILKVAEKLQGHPDIEFVFIGEGPEAKLLTETTLTNVRYLGPKAYAEIPGLISRAHVGFSARRDDDIGADAFPVKAFEYLGVGIPVVMTPASGVMGRLVPHGLFEFGNHEIDRIAQKLLELKERPLVIDSPKQFSRQEISRGILGFCDL